LKDYKDFFVLHNDLDSYTIQGTLEWKSNLLG
jgi:hypothetical protein